MQKTSILLAGLLIGVSVASARDYMPSVMPMAATGTRPEPKGIEMRGERGDKEREPKDNRKEQRYMPMNASGTMPIPPMMSSSSMRMHHNDDYWKASNTPPMPPIMGSSTDMRPTPWLIDARDGADIRPMNASGTMPMPRNEGDPRASGTPMNREDGRDRPMNASGTPMEGGRGEGKGKMPMPCPMPPMMMGTDTPMNASGTMPTHIHKMIASGTMPDLKKGDGNRNGKGAMVMMLQDMLIKLGYLDASSTGNYGELTRLAVLKYQKDMGVTNPNGSFGPLTKEKMKSKCAPARNDGEERRMPMLQ